MPVYVYKNLITGETFELQQRITESALTEHPETGEPVKRLIQPVGIAFKGSGFYVTDSRSSTPKETTSEKKDDIGKSEGKPESKTEGKPEKESKGEVKHKSEPKETTKAGASKD